jgi:sigma-E factor negative regulatory protein RseB
MRMARAVAAQSLLLLSFVGSQAPAQEARDWLERMNGAVEELNYRGTFVHVLLDGTPETLEIVHRNANGESGERILSLDGAGREIVRRGDQVQGILPDQRIVLLESRRDVSPLVARLPSSAEELDANYEIRLRGKARVADRAVRVLEIKPRDEFRYGYTLWLDEATAMPLRSQLFDERGRVVEQIHFTAIEIPADIPATDLEATIDTTGFTTLRAPESSPSSTGGNISWRAVAVPGGFKLSVATQSQMAGSDTPVEHLVYSDGLATVSVFIEARETKADVGEGFSNFGSTNAFSLTLRGRKVTAMGEVPPQTVRTIATSLVDE